MASGGARTVCRAARLAMMPGAALARPLTSRVASLAAGPTAATKTTATTTTRWISSVGARQAADTTSFDDFVAEVEKNQAAAAAATATAKKAAAAEEGEQQPPRWSYTPAAMKAPVSMQRPKDPKRSVWHTNEDPEVLDQFYARFLGTHGPRLLPDELKWLAVTHKSFDQGRRGFNDRLAYLGKELLLLPRHSAPLHSCFASPGHRQNEDFSRLLVLVLVDWD